MTDERRWKRTQESTGPHNDNLNNEEPEELIRKSRAGNIVAMTIATTTDGKRWTRTITPNKCKNKAHCRGTTRGYTRREKP